MHGKMDSLIVCSVWPLCGDAKQDLIHPVSYTNFELVRLVVNTSSIS
jgi:hypothetical protein